MLPTKIKARNYRSFAGEHELELRPITLIYGRNNVGKSALLRLLPLFADSVGQGATGALDLNSPAVRGGGFDDLQTKLAGSDDDDNSLGFGLEWAEGPLRAVDFSIEHDVARRLVVRDFSLALEGETLLFRRVPLPTSAPLTHRFDVGGGQVELELRGLRPVSYPKLLASSLDLLNAALSELNDAVQWLSANRGLSKRRFRQPAGPTLRLDPDGGNAPQALWSSPQLCERATGWLTQTIARSLELRSEPPDEFRCELHNARRSQPFAVDLVDSGNGPTQVLPVLTAVSMLEQEWGPRMLALEEPGANLDVEAQRALASALCASARGLRQPRLVIETHSQAMLLGVQLAVADPENSLKSADVVIYWVRQDERGASHVERFELDAEGRFVGLWPDPFRPTRELARELVLLHQRRLRGRS